VVTLGLAWRYLGSYMAAVFEGRVHFLGFVERPIYRMLGTSPEQEQTWKRYAGAMIIFSAVSIAFTYVILRIQGSLPFNPQHFGAVGPALSFNTATSFVTNTNWQNYGGETSMSYFSQMGALTVQQFVSAAVGIAAAIVLVRGFSRRKSPTIGNFWVDITRCLFYVLLPISFIAGIVLVGQGAVDTLAGTTTFHDALNGVTQTIARGPAGFMGSIMQLGTNGGGFFNVDLAHPLENPTGLTNLLYIWLTLSIPFALTYTFGKMVGSIRHGVALLAVMVIIFGVWVGFTANAGQHGGQRGPLRRHHQRPVQRVYDPDLRWCRRQCNRFVQPNGRLRTLVGHDARRSDAGWHGLGALYTSHLRDHRRVHRRIDDRAHA
jgi:K+-transporting ATPase ATPase A chain